MGQDGSTFSTQNREVDFHRQERERILTSLEQRTSPNAIIGHSYEGFWRPELEEKSVFAHTALLNLLGHYRAFDVSLALQLYRRILGWRVNPRCREEVEKRNSFNLSLLWCQKEMDSPRWSTGGSDSPSAASAYFLASMSLIRASIRFPCSDQMAQLLIQQRNSSDWQQLVESPVLDCGDGTTTFVDICQETLNRLQKQNTSGQVAESRRMVMVTITRLVMREETKFIEALVQAGHVSLLKAICLPNQRFSHVGALFCASPQAHRPAFILPEGFSAVGSEVHMESACVVSPWIARTPFIKNQRTRQQRGRVQVALASKVLRSRCSSRTDDTATLKAQSILDPLNTTLLKVALGGELFDNLQYRCCTTETEEGKADPRTLCSTLRCLVLDLGLQVNTSQGPQEGKTSTTPFLLAVSSPHAHPEAVFLLWRELGAVPTWVPIKSPVCSSRSKIQNSTDDGGEKEDLKTIITPGEEINKGMTENIATAKFSLLHHAAHGEGAAGLTTAAASTLTPEELNPMVTFLDGAPCFWINASPNPTTTNDYNSYWNYHHSEDLSKKAILEGEVISLAKEYHGFAFPEALTHLCLAEKDDSQPLTLLRKAELLIFGMGLPATSSVATASDDGRSIVLSVILRALLYDLAAGDEQQSVQTLMDFKLSLLEDAKLGKIRGLQACISAILRCHRNEIQRFDCRLLAPTQGQMSRFFETPVLSPVANQNPPMAEEEFECITLFGAAARGGYYPFMIFLVQHFDVSPLSCMLPLQKERSLLLGFPQRSESPLILAAHSGWCPAIIYCVKAIRHHVRTLLSRNDTAVDDVSAEFNREMTRLLTEEEVDYRTGENALHVLARNFVNREKGHLPRCSLFVPNQVLPTVLAWELDSARQASEALGVQPPSDGRPLFTNLSQKTFSDFSASWKLLTKVSKYNTPWGDNEEEQERQRQQQRDASEDVMQIGSLGDGTLLDYGLEENLTRSVPDEDWKEPLEKVLGDCSFLKEHPFAKDDLEKRDLVVGAYRGCRRLLQGYRYNCYGQWATHGGSETKNCGPWCCYAHVLAQCPEALTRQKNKWGHTPIDIFREFPDGYKP